MSRDRAVLARFFIAAEGRRLGLGLLLAVLTTLLGIGLLGLAGWFITATALAGLQLATALAFDVFMPSAGIRLFALGRTASRYGERLLTHDATLGVLARLREQILRASTGADTARRLTRRPARALFRLTSDIDALETPFLRAVVPAAATFGAALAVGLVTGLQSPPVGVAVFGWMLLAGWGSALWLGRRATRPSAVRGVALERLRTRTADLVAGQADLAMAGRLGAQCDAIGASEQRLAGADDALNRLEARARFAQGAASAVLLGGVLIAAGWLVETGRIGAPVAALMVLCCLAATEPFGALRRGALDAARARLAARRLAPLLRREADAAGRRRAEAGAPPEDAVVPPEDAVAPPADAVVPRTGDGVAAEEVLENGAPAVVFRGVAFGWPGSRTPTLVVPSLRIDRGETVAITGPSGAGKSSLFALLAGDLPPDSGRITTLPAGWLTQQVDLFEDSIRANLLLAAPAASDSDLVDALMAAGLAETVAALPARLDTRLGEGGLGLSGGQARRLAVARLLLARRPLWLLDEPTEALDAATARDVLDRLRPRFAGATVVIATHLRREAAVADRLLVIDQGRIVADLARASAGHDRALAALRPD